MGTTTSAEQGKSSVHSFPNDIVYAVVAAVVGVLIIIVSVALVVRKCKRTSTQEIEMPSRKKETEYAFILFIFL